jgi:hypothetical protein
VRANSVPRPPSVVEVNECLRSRRAQPGADHLGFSEVGLENACESFGQAGGTEESVERFDGGCDPTSSGRPRNGRQPERQGRETRLQHARRERYKNAPTWTRTKNLLIKSQLLYQLSYRGLVFKLQYFASCDSSSRASLYNRG